MSAGAASPARAILLVPHALVASLVGGLAGALALPAPPPAAIAGTVLAGLLAARSILRGRARAAVVALAGAALIAGWAWGTARVEATHPVPLRLPTSVSGLADVVSPPRSGAGGPRAEIVAVRLRDAAGRAVPAGTRLLAEFGRDPPVALGSRLAIRARLSAAVGPATPGWWRAHLARRSLAARASVTTHVIRGRRGGLAGLRDRLRNAAGAAAGRGSSGEAAAVVRGLALGGGDGLSQRTAQAFRDAGLWHLLAVSGQNVAVVAMAVLAVLGALGAGRRAALVCAMVVLVAYCLACDGGASVARAGVVGALGLAGEVGSRARDRWHLLLVGLAALTAYQPRVLADPGLQLSFGAVVGIFALAPPIRRWLAAWVPDPVAVLAAQAAAATTATAPILIWHFGTLSLAGLVVNVVAVPLAAPIVVLALSGIALGWLLPPLALAVGWVAGMGATILIGVARVAALAPGAAVTLPRWSALVAVVPALAVPIVAARLWGTRPRRTPARPARGGAIVLVVVVGAVALAAPARVPAPRWPTGPAVSALDVGQGDAILLRSRDGAAALVDTGPPGAPAPVVARLRALGVRHLDVVILTHHQRDHDGAAEAIADAVDVETFLAAPRTFENVRAVRGVPIGRLAAGDELHVGDWDLHVLWPRPDAPAAADPNDDSLVLHAVAGDIDVLLTGDAESDILAGLPVGPVDVLKVSHHGSADHGLGGLVRRLRPSVALVSVGTGNPYGHPAASTLSTLASARVAVHRTDTAGTITVIAASGQLRITETASAVDPG